MRSTQRSRVQQQNRRQNNPVSYNTRLTPSMPSIPRITRGKDIIVEQVRESVGFSAKQYILNPKYAPSFPSASLSAQRYDMYEFEELEFHYHPTRAVTNTPGVVFLGWEPNANRGTPAGVKEINAYEYHVEGAAYSPNIILKVNKSHLPPPRYCRDVPTSSDLNLYDTGSLIVCTDAFEGSDTMVGYIEVFYKIRFYNYHLDDPMPVQKKVLALDHPAQGSGAPGVPVDIDGLAVVEGGEWLSVSTDSFTAPAGKYLLVWTIGISFGTQAQADFWLRINGSQKAFTSMATPTSGGRGNGTIHDIVTLGSTDVVTIQWSASQPGVVLDGSILTLQILN